MKDFPSIEKFQIAVLQAELSTGVIYNKNGNRYWKQGDSRFLIFNSEQEVLDFIAKKERNNIEYLLYDSDRKYLRSIIKEGSITTVPSRPWWKFWVKKQ